LPGTYITSQASGTTGGNGVYNISLSYPNSVTTTITGTTYDPINIDMHSTSALTLNVPSGARAFGYSSYYTSELVTTGNITIGASAYIYLNYSILTCSSFSTGASAYIDLYSCTLTCGSFSAGASSVIDHDGSNTIVKSVSGAVFSASSSTLIGSSRGSSTIILDSTGTSSANTRSVLLPVSKAENTFGIGFTTTNPTDTVTFTGTAALLDLTNFKGVANISNLKCVRYKTIVSPGYLSTKTVTIFSDETVTYQYQYSSGAYFNEVGADTDNLNLHIYGSDFSSLYAGAGSTLMNLYVHDSIYVTSNHNAFKLVNIGDSSTFTTSGINETITIANDGSFTCAPTATIDGLLNITFNSSDSTGTFNTGGKTYGNVSVKNNNTEAATTFTINNSGNTAAINTLTLQECTALINNNLTITNIIAPSTNQYESGILLRNIAASTFTFSTLTALTPNIFYISTDNGTSNQVTVNFDKRLLIGTNSTVNTTGETSPYISKVATGYTVSTLYVNNSIAGGNANILFVYTGPTSTSNFFLIF